eukprot:392401_1
MANTCFLLSIILIVITLLNCCYTFKFYDGLVNTRVQSATYLTNAVTKILITVEIKNFGAEKTDKYLVSLPKSLDNNLALIEIYDSNKNRLQMERETNIDFSSIKISQHTLDHSIFYSVELPQILASDNGKTSQQLKFTIAYIHQLEPLPKQIKKTSKQFVVYQANKYFYSPYKTEKLGTKYTFASDKFKSYTKPAAEVDGKKITYGPYKDIKPFSNNENVRFHFQFHVPYLTMTQVIRDIEISHWGNVRIEESYLLKHDGAKLKGAYEVGMYDRYEHVMGSMAASSDPSSVRSYRATLPSGASNVYYVDRIGNVSTSNFRLGSTSKTGKKDKKSILEIRPRYPLYGGWKTDFIIGYDVPSSELISIDSISRVHTLNISFNIPFKDPVTDLLITIIALPEGAHDVKVICPYDILLELESKRFTYLDTIIGGGRPLITFKKTNVINLHNQNFQITYVYDTTRIYYKPILIVVGIFTFFATIMILSRVSPSLEISKTSLHSFDEQQQIQIDKIIKLKKNASPNEILKKLEKINKKLKDEIIKNKIEKAIQEIKDIVKSYSNTNTKGGKKSSKGNKNEIDVDTKANVANVLRSLQENL